MNSVGLVTPLRSVTTSNHETNLKIINGDVKNAYFLFVSLGFRRVLQAIRTPVFRFFCNG